MNPIPRLVKIALIASAFVAPWCSSTAARTPLSLTITPLQVVNPEICADPPNPIVAENCLPGTDEWRVEAIGEIEGFASTTSVAPGEIISFYVNTTAPTFDLFIYRSGYYAGQGGRLIAKIENLPGQVQPACLHERETGLLSCSNWSVSHALTIPENWTSGIYVAKIVRSDNGGENFIIFVVRDDERLADILYQQSVTTYQAYNYYGGYSVYLSDTWNICPTIAGAKRAVKVSFDRPYLAPMTEFNMYFHAEYPMVSWLESQGYDVTYSTNIDTHISGMPGQPNRLLNHRVFLISGHDEYWSQEMRDAITAARDAGIHLAVFSANTGYWRIRFEDDLQTGKPLRTMVTYKTTESGPADPSGIHTGTWRDPNGANDPENRLLGSMYMGDNSALFFPLRVTAENAQHRLYRHTGLAEMPAGSYVNIGRDLIGWEWDQVVDNGYTPEGLQILAESPVIGKFLLDAGRDYSSVQEGVAHTTQYVASSGAIVFAAGTIHWALGLDVVEPNPIVRQITYNLLADMGVQPTTPDEALVLDSEVGETILDIPALYLDRQERAPTISDLQIRAESTRIVASWRTDSETNGQVWYGTEPEHLNKWAPYNDLEFTLEHQIEIPYLEPATRYYVQVISTNRAGKSSFSDLQSIETTNGSLTEMVRSRLRPTAGSIYCWVQANTIPTILIICILVLIIVTPIIWYGRRLLRDKAHYSKYP